MWNLFEMAAHDYSDIILSVPDNEAGEEIVRALDAIVQRLEREAQHDAA